MPNNPVLEYIDLICRTRYSTKHSFFENKKSFDPTEPTPNTATLTGNRTPLRRSHLSFGSRELEDSPIDLVTDSPPLTQELPIHTILKDIYSAVESNNTEYFEPMILHYWQLQRLLEILRCNTKVLALPAQQRTNNAKIKQLREEIGTATHPDTRRAKEREIKKLEQENRDIQIELDREQNALRLNQRPQDKDNIQAVLILSTLLNIVYRQGMSVPLLSDQFRLEAQQQECKYLLREYCGIEFNQLETAFPELFATHWAVQTVKTVPERILSELKEDWTWLRGRSPTTLTDDEKLANARYYVSRVMGAQRFHADYNHPRLGFTRSRRLFAFLDPFLQNETYSSAFKTIDPYLRFILAYVNWMFFLPRLSLNLSLLSHHLLNDVHLGPLEQKLPRWIRFRAHWTRFWFELINDSYWILNGLLLCFWLPGGAMSPQGIILSFVVQSLDLTCSIVRAGIEWYRLYKMSSDFAELDPNHALKQDMNKRFWFEALALGYMVFHFSVLVLSLYLTLPTMAAISTIWPVVGGVGAVLITISTYYMQPYLANWRETEFECRPKPLVLSQGMARLPSTGGESDMPGHRVSRFF